MVIASQIQSSTPAFVPEQPMRVGVGGGVRLSAQWHRPSMAAPGAPVLLAHGFGQTRQAWSRTAEALAAAGHPALAFDARGHGESDRNPEGRRYAGEDLVADLVAMAGQCPSPPVLVGASMGGLLGLLAQAERPTFGSMVLVDITPRWEQAGVRRILDFMGAHPQGFDSLEHAASEIQAYLPHRRERKSPAQLDTLLRQGDDGRWRWHWDPRLLAEFADDSHQYQARMAEAAGRIDIPVLLVSGGRSDLVSAETVGEFLALVPHARHVQLPEATHMVAGDQNDAFTRTILDFLADHGSLSPCNAAPGESP